MKPYNVWITCPDPKFFNDLVGTLVKRGFSVLALGRTAVLTYADKPASVIAVQLLRTPKTDEETAAWGATGIHDEVVDALKVNKAKFHSIVVSASENCTWNTGNVSIAQMEREDAEKNKTIN
jgi:hypothetical protein